MKINKKYNIIYADPPWKYNDKRKNGYGGCENHYDILSNNEIYNLPVKNISSKNCILFIWVTFPFLKEGLKTIESWGFLYKTCAFTWIKRNKNNRKFFFGIGNWTASNAELCLLATKGKPKRVFKNISQIIDTHLESHSKKPSIVRDKIVKLCGDLPRIELFARKENLGWDSFGNEIDKFNSEDLLFNENNNVSSRSCDSNNFINSL